MSHMPRFFPENKLVRIKALLILFPGGTQVFLERGIAGVTRNKWKKKKKSGSRPVFGCVAVIQLALCVVMDPAGKWSVTLDDEWCPTKGVPEWFYPVQEARKKLRNTLCESFQSCTTQIYILLVCLAGLRPDGKGFVVSLLIAMRQNKHLRWLMSPDQQNLQPCSYLALACAESSSSEWERSQDALRDLLKSNQTDRLWGGNILLAVCMQMCPGSHRKSTYTTDIVCENLQNTLWFALIWDPCLASFTCQDKEQMFLNALSVSADFNLELVNSNSPRLLLKIIQFCEILHGDT